MDDPNLTMTQQVAQSATAFQRQRTGHASQAVTVVVSEDTLGVMLCKASMGRRMRKEGVT